MLKRRRNIVNKTVEKEKVGSNIIKITVIWVWIIEIAKELKIKELTKDTKQILIKLYLQ